MVSQDWKKRWAMLKLFVRDYTLHWSAAGLVIGMIILVLGIMSFFFASTLPEDWKAGLTTGGRYDICAGGFGLLFVVFAGYYFVDNIYKRRKFNRLFDTASREKFVKNRDKLEELAFDLSTKHENMVQKKVKEMKIR